MPRTYKILVIDDTASRSKSYELFFQKLSKSVDTIVVEPTIPKDVGSCIKLLKSNEHFDFCLLDLVLSEDWLEGYRHSEIIDGIVGSSTPFVVVSNAYDADSGESLSTIFRSGARPAWLMHFDEFKKNKSGVHSYFCKFMENEIAKERSADLPFWLEPDETLNVLTVTDFHLTEETLESTQTVVNSLVTERAKKLGQSKLHLVLGLGDFVHRGNHNMFDKATELLTKLAQNPPGTNDAAILLVPGNHDVELIAAYSDSTHLAKNETGDYMPESSDRPAVNVRNEFGFFSYNKFHNFNSIIPSKIDGFVNNSWYWTKRDTTQLGVEFFGVNTNQIKSDSYKPVSPFLTTNIVHKISQEVQTDTLKIGLFHAAPVAIPGLAEMRKIENHDDIYKQFESLTGNTLFVHGDIHTNRLAGLTTTAGNVFNLSVAPLGDPSVAGGSPGPGFARGCTLLQISRESCKAVSICATFYLHIGGVWQESEQTEEI